MRITVMPSHVCSKVNVKAPHLDAPESEEERKNASDTDTFTYWKGQDWLVPRGRRSVAREAKARTKIHNNVSDSNHDP